MKVQFDASPEDVIAESIRRKIRTMNVSTEQQQKCVTTHVTSYILKVCGCEEFLLGDYPISQYKVFFVSTIATLVVDSILDCLTATFRNLL